MGLSVHTEGVDAEGEHAVKQSRLSLKAATIFGWMLMRHLGNFRCTCCFCFKESTCSCTLSQSDGVQNFIL